jgi:hypothetical protein
LTSDIGRKLGAVAKILIVMMVLATAAVATASTASAATTSAPVVTAVQSDTTATDSHGCPAHSLCLWVNSGFQGGLFFKTFGSVQSNVWLFTSGFNDVASSLDNNRGDESGIDKDFPASLPNFFCFRGGKTISNFAGQGWPDGTSLNDSVSSFQLSSSSTSCATPG